MQPITFGSRVIVVPEDRWYNQEDDEFWTGTVDRITDWGGILVRFSDGSDEWHVNEELQILE